MPEETQQEQWAGLERRRMQVDQTLLLKLVDKVEQLTAKVDATHMSLIESRSELHKLQENFEKHRNEESMHIHAIMNAFPERDFEDHFDYHEQKRRSAKSWGEIWLDIKKKILSGLAWAFLMTVALAVWEYIKSELRK